MLKHWENKPIKLLSPELDDFPGIPIGIDHVDEFFNQFGRVMSVNLEHTRNSSILYRISMVFEEFPTNITQQAKDIGIFIERSSISTNADVQPVYSIGRNFVDWRPMMRQIEGTITFRLQP